MNKNSIDIANIIKALDRTGEARIIVFGDYALDKYFYIDPERDEPSAETGLPAYQVHKKYLSAGVGGTITQNLRALGANVVCIGVVGNDGEGYELMNILNGIGADTKYMVHSDNLFTCTYIKPMRRNADGEYVELNRIDIRNHFEPPVEIQNQMLDKLREAIPNADAVLVIDQFYQRNQGAVTDYIRESLAKIALENPGKLFYADSRSFINEYSNMVLKCNNLELFRKFAGGSGNPESLDEIIEEGRKLSRKTGRLVFVTRGDKGMVSFNGDDYTVIPAFEVKGETDIVGAGDATNASLVLGMTLGLSPAEAGTLACAVSSITIQQIGTTGTASPEEAVAVLRTREQ